MPELPEVETVARDLRPLLVGQRIDSLIVGERSLRKPWSADRTPLVVGRTVRELRRRGKWLPMILDDGTAVVFHLGMTGQMTVHAVGEALADHVHFRIRLGTGERELRFRDIRRFGSIAWYATYSIWEESLDEPLGPEPWDLTTDGLLKSLEKTIRPIKAVLLDQSVVAGVGNIYADESLFLTGLHPTTTGRSVTRPQAEKLRAAIVDVLTRSIASRGSTIRNYVGGSGLAGGHQTSLAVYGRTGEECIVCGTAVECIRLAGRSTHFCPKCQRVRVDGLRVAE